MKKKMLSLGLALVICASGFSTFAFAKSETEYPQESQLVSQTKGGEITPQHYTTCIGKSDVYKATSTRVASYGITNCSGIQERISVLNTLTRNGGYVSSDQDVQTNSATAYAEGGTTAYNSSWSYKSASHHNSTHDGVTSGTYTEDTSL